MLSPQFRFIIRFLSVGLLVIIIWGLHTRINNFENRVNAVVKQQPDENVGKITLDSLSDGSYRLVPSGHWVFGSCKNVQDVGTYNLYKADSSAISGWKLVCAFGDTSFTDIRENKVDLQPEIWLRQSDGSVVRYGEVSERGGDNWETVEVNLDSSSFSIGEFYKIHLIH